MKNFILLDHEPFTKRRKELFYDLFEKAGLKLEVWDLSQWLHQGYSNPDEIKNRCYLKKIYNYTQYIEFLNLKDPNQDIFIEEVFREPKNYIVFKELKSRNFKTIKINLYGNSAIKGSLKDKLFYYSIIDLKNSFKNKIVQIVNRKKIKFFKDYKPHLIISSNKYDFPDYYFNSPDYELYKFNINNPILKYDYIVFCDIYFGKHTDEKFLYNSKTKYNFNNYYLSLNEFFNYLEDKYKIPVVVAAHPKSDYTGTEFGNRKIIKYETANLVINSKYVISHISNSISYSILANKPIVLITTNEYNKVPKIKYVLNLYNKTLKLNIINIDKFNYKNKNIFNLLNKELMNEYIYTYLTSHDTDNLQNFEILKKYLESI